jgi:hypothetical protein
MKIKNGNKNQKQQGDVILKKIEALTEGGVKFEPVLGSYVIAQGSAGGNSHVLNAVDGLTVYKFRDGFEIEAKNKVTLVHTATIDKHDDIVMTGLWRINFVVETDPFSKIISQVKD